MKTCSQCGTQYTDDTLRFCLQDGTPLHGSNLSGEPTVSLGEIETAARRGERIEVPIEHGTSSTGPDSQMTRLAPAAKRGTNVLAVVGIVGVALLLIIAALAAGGLWLYSRNSQAELGSRSGNSNAVNGGTLPNSSTPAASPTIPKATPVPSASATASPPPSPPPMDNAQLRNEVLRKVYSWKSALEARDFNTYMGNYADTVDYYRRRGVSVDSIRADKARAFQMYDAMRVDISNEVATTSSDGSSATVTFDKEWHFSGRTPSEGKTKSQLDLARINGRWLITGERDLQVYYKR